MTAPESTITLTGGLYSITPRITAKGHRWLTADLVNDKPDGTQVRHLVEIYPEAHEALAAHITAGAAATVTVTGPGYVTEMTIADHHWQDTDGSRSAFVAGLSLPWGPDPVSVAQVLQTVKREADYLFNPRWLPGSRRPKLGMLLFFAQGHHLAHFHRPLFDAPIYATSDGVSVALPDPAGDRLAPGQWNSVDDVLSRYKDMHLADLRSLIRASDPWQTARNGSGTGEIYHALMDQWFSRAEEFNDPDDERPTKRQAASAGQRLRSERIERAEEKTDDETPEVAR